MISACILHCNTCVAEFEARLGVAIKTINRYRMFDKSVPTVSFYLVDTPNVRADQKRPIATTISFHFSFQYTQ